MVYKTRPLSPRATASHTQSLAPGCKSHSPAQLGFFQWYLTLGLPLHLGRNFLGLSRGPLPSVPPSHMAVGGSPTCPVPTFLYSPCMTLLHVSLCLCFCFPENTHGTRPTPESWRSDGVWRLDCPPSRLSRRITTQVACEAHLVLGMRWSLSCLKKKQTDTLWWPGGHRVEWSCQYVGWGIWKWRGYNVLKERAAGGFLAEG